MVVLLLLGAGIGATWGPPPGQQPWWYLVIGIIAIVSLVALSARHVRRYEADEETYGSAQDGAVNPLR